MFDFFEISCPYCGESQDVDVDSSAGEQAYWQDCQVCCAPILMELSISVSGEVELRVKRDDEC
jgi:hypothetical protein